MSRLLPALFAVAGLLAEKGIVAPAEISERMAITDRASPAQGARMIARAWTDPSYRALMLSDGRAAAEAMGIPMRGALPLYEWMRTHITPLVQHPNDPARTRAIA